MLECKGASPMSPDQTSPFRIRHYIETPHLRNTVFLLILLLLLLFASCHPLFGQPPSPQKNSQAPRSSGSISKDTLNFRSVSHPFSQSASLQDAYSKGRVHPLIPVVSAGKRVWGSEDVNTFVCSLETPEVTWLGTLCGVKRLDKRSKTVRHYTALDGLPSNHTLSLGACDGEIYCTTRSEYPPSLDNSKYDRFNVRLCLKVSRFDSKLERWETVAQNEIASPQFVNVIENRMNLTVSLDFNGELSALVTPLEGGETKKFVYSIPGVKKNHISYAHSDSNGLWAGTDIGLFHYDFKSKHWNRLLTNLLVGAGCSDEDGSLWLTTKKSEPFKTDDRGNETSVFHWDITHVTPDKPPKHILLYHSRESKYASTPVFPTILKVDKKIWAVEDRGLFSNWHGIGTSLPAIYSYNMKSDESEIAVRYTSPFESYDIVPAPVLKRASSRFTSPEYTASIRRFPGWICVTEDDEKSETASASPPQLDYSALWRTSDRVTDPYGKTLSKPALIHLIRTSETESYPFPEFKIRVHRPVSRAVKIGGMAYFISLADSCRLFCWDLKRNIASPAPELDAVLSYQKNRGMLHYYWRQMSRFRMIVDGASIWIGTGTEVIKFDPRSKKVVVWKTPMGHDIGDPSPFWMMSAGKGKAWGPGAKNELLMAGDETSSDLKIIKLPVFESGEYRDEPTLFAMEDDIAWFKSETSTPPIQTSVFGYDLRTRERTSSFISNSPVFKLPTPYASWKQDSIRWFETDQSAIGYNKTTGEWTSLPSLPSEMRTSRLKLKIELGQSRDAPIPRVKFGDVLLAPSDAGLWAYDLKSEKKAQSPPIEVGCENIGFRVCAWDKNFVWLMGYLEQTLLRFELNTKSWKSFDVSEAMRSEQWNGNCVADGESFWLGTNKNEFHWNTKSEIWEKVADQIGEIQGGTVFSKVVPDGDNVWLVPHIYDFTKPASVKNSFPAELKRLEIPLYRYHIPSHSYFPVQLLTNEPALPYDLTVSKFGAILTTSEGCFRYDRKKETWGKLSVPKMPDGFPTTHIWSAYEDDKSYWFVNGSNANTRGEVLQLKK